MKLLLQLTFSFTLVVISINETSAQEVSDSLNIGKRLKLSQQNEVVDDKTVAMDTAAVLEVRKQKKDTIKYPLLSGLAIYFDYPKLFSFFTEFENKAEVGLETQLFKHIILRTELGRSRIHPVNFYTNANYEVSGNYFRVGAAYTKQLGGTGRLFLGFNYGSSFFDDKGNIQIESPSELFSPFEERFRRTGLRGDWFELTFGTESHLGKNLYFGFIARLRKLNSYDSFEELDVLSVPGYGRTFDSSIPAINLYLKYRVQFY